MKTRFFNKSKSSFKITKILLFNFTLFLILLILIELIFGFWFKKDSFGLQMRGKRLQTVVVNKENKKIIYKRDYYGFRENFDDKYDLSNIKILINGGSTIDELLLKYEDTIGGQLNKKLKENNIDLKIYNAGIAGKSSRGHINEFEEWFDKLKNFNPKIIIYYIGWNDRWIKDNEWADSNLNLGFSKKIIWTFSQKSFFWYKIKIIKDKFFPKHVFAYGTKDEKIIKEISKNKFFSYEYAIQNYKQLTLEEKRVVKSYNNNLELLKDKLHERDITPVFITQIDYQINGDKLLHHLNKALKEFCKKNNLLIINLDELVEKTIADGFVDEVHTNEKGSYEISNYIYPYVENIIRKFYKN